MEGWITLHRKILNWQWYHNTNVFRVFMHLLLNANYEDKYWNGIIIKRGQVVTSIRNISKETGLSIQHTRTAITNLQKTKEITIKTTNKYSLVTIEKYNDYQNKSVENNTQINTQKFDELTNKQHTSQQQHNNKQYNNINSINLNKEKELKLFDSGDDFYKYLIEQGYTEDSFNELSESEQEMISENYILRR